MNTTAPVYFSTDYPTSYGEYFRRLFVPSKDSHKGQNGKVLIIGGSSLFHSAVIWPAEVASHFADMVHVASTQENNEIIRTIKEKWQNGIVISQQHLPEYIAEDDVILLGNGMMRVEGDVKPHDDDMPLKEILHMPDEGERTFYLTRYLLRSFPEKRFVLDAGALQMMKADWLSQLKTPSVVTPHQKEFEGLFGVSVCNLDETGKAELVRKTAAHYHTVILLKAGYDIVSDGVKTFIIKGGNAGLTKGGTGDILAGLATVLYAKNAPIDAAVAASILLKKTAEDLKGDQGIWFNNTDLIAHLPHTMHKLMEQYSATYNQEI